MPDPANSRRPITFTVTNDGNERIALRDGVWITIENSGGQVVFSDVAGRAVAPILSGQSAEYVWDQTGEPECQVEAGLYTVEIWYIAGGCAYVLSAEFEILEE